MWLPGYERYEYPGLAGKPYQYTHNPKGCMHTTEGASIAGAMDAYAPYPPHLIYDWRSRRGVQHVRLDRAAYSAMDGNDDDYMIQVELVGFAADTRSWPEQALRNIAEDVVAPLERAFGIPRRIIPAGFKDGRDGLVLASATSPIRLSPAGLRDFAGWLGHQHLPAPDTHWDPGALPMAKILSYLEDDMPLTPADVNLLLYGTPLWNGMNLAQVLLAIDTNAGQAHLKVAGVQKQVAAIAANPAITPAELERITREATAAAGQKQVEQIVTGLREEISGLVEDALQRVQDADNVDEAKRTVEELLRRLGTLGTTQS